MLEWCSNLVQEVGSSNIGGVNSSFIFQVKNVLKSIKKSLSTNKTKRSTSDGGNIKNQSKRYGHVVERGTV